MNDDVGREYLEPGRFVDSAHPAVVAFARREAEGLADPREIAVRLYYAVRDGLRYDPYDIDTRPSGMTASACLARGVGFCVTKAATYAQWLTALREIVAHESEANQRKLFHDNAVKQYGL